MKLRERVGGGKSTVFFSSTYIFLPCSFAKNGTSEDLRGEQELIIAKITSDNTTHLSHTLCGTQKGNLFFISLLFDKDRSIYKDMIQLLWNTPLFGNVTLTVATLFESLGHLKVTERCGSFSLISV